MTQKATPNQETEIKLRVPDASALRRSLKKLRARILHPRTHEFNTLFDTEDKSLYRRGKIVRLRIERSGPVTNSKRTGAGLKADRAILTFKAPVYTVGAPGKRATTTYKVKREFEVLVADAEQMALILMGLGLRPVFRYEKIRTTYVFPDLKNVKIEFDETPVGTFLELEGQPAGIDRAASRLGYTRHDYVTESYGALHVARSRKLGIKAGDMLFTIAKKSR